MRRYTLQQRIKTHYENCENLDSLYNSTMWLSWSTLSDLNLVKNFELLGRVKMWIMKSLHFSQEQASWKSRFEVFSLSMYLFWFLGIFPIFVFHWFSDVLLSNLYSIFLVIAQVSQQYVLIRSLYSFHTLFIKSSEYAYWRCTSIFHGSPIPVWFLYQSAFLGFVWAVIYFVILC